MIICHKLRHHPSGTFICVLVLLDLKLMMTGVVSELISQLQSGSQLFRDSPSPCRRRTAAARCCNYTKKFRICVYFSLLRKSLNMNLKWTQFRVFWTKDLKWSLYMLSFFLIKSFLHKKWSPLTCAGLPRCIPKRTTKNKYKLWHQAS